MIDFIRTWANQIIVAVIISTIFEMLLPNGNNKKYIKMIIGIYVLFTVIQPIASKLTGKELSISSFNYEKYLDQDILGTSSKDFENNNSKLIEQAYIDNIKNDLETKIAQKGYKIINCSIDIITNENQTEYGAIERIALNIEKIEKLEEKSNVVEVEKVEVKIDKDKSESINKSNLIDKEKNEIIEYIADEYSIDKKKIIIN